MENASTNLQRVKNVVHLNICVEITIKLSVLVKKNNIETAKQNLQLFHV